MSANTIKDGYVTGCHFFHENRKNSFFESGLVKVRLAGHQCMWLTGTRQHGKILAVAWKPAPSTYVWTLSQRQS